MDTTLQALDRWRVQAAERFTLTLGDTHVTVHQQPQQLSSRRLGVGAATWDGAFVLSALLGACLVSCVLLVWC